MLLQVLRLTPDACQILCTLTGHAGRVCSLAFPPEGAILLSGSEDQSTRVWDLPHELQRAERERTSQRLKQQQQGGATARPHEQQQAEHEPSSLLSKHQQGEPWARHQQSEGQTRQQQQPEQQPAGRDGDGNSQRQQAPDAASSHRGKLSASLVEKQGGPAADAGSGWEPIEASSSALHGRQAATTADTPRTAAAALAGRPTGSATSEPEAAAEPPGGHAAAVEGRSTPCLGEADAADVTAQMPGSSLEVASPAGTIAGDTPQPQHLTASAQDASPSLTQEEGPATSRVPFQPASPSRAAEPQEGDKPPPFPAHGLQQLMAPGGLQPDTEATSGPQAPLQGHSDSAAEGLQAAARAARAPVAGGKAQRKAAARYLPSLGAQQLVTADGVAAQVSRHSTGRLDMCAVPAGSCHSCACICTDVRCCLCGSTDAGTFLLLPMEHFVCSLPEPIDTSLPCHTSAWNLVHTASVSSVISSCSSTWSLL